MFAADVAVDDHNLITQDGSCKLAHITLVHSQGTFCRVVDFRINTTAPAVGLSRVPQKTAKTTLRIILYHVFVSWLHELEKTFKKNTATRTRIYVLVQQ